MFQYVLYLGFAAKLILVALLFGLSARNEVVGIFGALIRQRLRVFIEVSLGVPLTGHLRDLLLLGVEISLFV